MGHCCSSCLPTVDSHPHSHDVVLNQLISNSSSIAISDCIDYKPDIKYGMVVKVYDGDTITIATHLNGDMGTLYKFSVRLARIDCPELRTKDEAEKRCAIIARDRLYLLMNEMGNIVRLDNVGYDKYGRILAEVYLLNKLHMNSSGGINVSNWMIEQRLAVVYNGGTKQSIEWMKYMGIDK
jgi:endonuclease YncB( thermonuclease family)